MNYSQKERLILKYHLELIFNAFNSELAIMELELGDFIFLKQEHNYFFYIVIYWAIILLFFTLNIITLIFRIDVFNIIKPFILLALIIFQNKFYRTFPYNYSRYRTERKYILEQLRQLTFIINDSYLVYKINIKKYLSKFEKVKTRVEYFANCYQPKRYILKDIGIIAILTSLSTRIVYDLISSLISNYPFDFLSILSMFFESWEFLLILLFFLVIITPPLINHRRIAKSGYKASKKVIKLNIKLKLLREFIKIMEILIGLPKIFPELLSIKNVAHLFKKSKKVVIDQIYNKIFNDHTKLN